MNFGEYLKQIRKEKGFSQRALSEKCGISNAEISRIETGERQKPSPDVLKSLAPVLEVPYEELMNKAGYLNERSTFMQEARHAEEKFIELITPKLIKDGWKVELTRPSSIGDILAIKDDTYWYLDLKFSRNFNENERNFRHKMFSRDILTRTCGYISIFDKTPISKFTIAVTNQDVFNTICSYTTKNLNVIISVMLLDFDTNSIMSEHELTENKPLF